MTNDELDAIDRKLAEKCMGWFNHNHEWVTVTASTTSPGIPVFECFIHDWHPTCNIAQAFMVLEKLHPIGFSISSFEGKDYNCSLTAFGGLGEWHVVLRAETPALAICLAGLKCIGEDI